MSDEERPRGLSRKEEGKAKVGEEDYDDDQTGQKNKPGPGSGNPKMSDEERPRGLSRKEKGKAKVGEEDYNDDDDDDDQIGQRNGPAPGSGDGSYSPLGPLVCFCFSKTLTSYEVNPKGPVLYLNDYETRCLLDSPDINSVSLPMKLYVFDIQRNLYTMLLSPCARSGWTGYSITAGWGIFVSYCNLVPGDKVSFHRSRDIDPYHILVKKSDKLEIITQFKATDYVKSEPRGPGSRKMNEVAKCLSKTLTSADLDEQKPRLNLTVNEAFLLTSRAEILDDDPESFSEELDVFDECDNRYRMNISNLDTRSLMRFHVNTGWEIYAKDFDLKEGDVLEIYRFLDHRLVPGRFYYAIKLKRKALSVDREKTPRLSSKDKGKSKVWEEENDVQDDNRNEPGPRRGDVFYSSSSPLFSLCLGYQQFQDPRKSEFGDRPVPCYYLNKTFQIYGVNKLGVGQLRNLKMQVRIVYRTATFDEDIQFGVLLSHTNYSRILNCDRVGACIRICCAWDNMCPLALYRANSPYDVYSSCDVPSVIYTSVSRCYKHFIKEMLFFVIGIHKKGRSMNGFKTENLGVLIESEPHSLKFGGVLFYSDDVDKKKAADFRSISLVIKEIVPHWRTMHLLKELIKKLETCNCGSDLELLCNHLALMSSAEQVNFIRNSTEKKPYKEHIDYPKFMASVKAMGSNFGWTSKFPFGSSGTGPLYECFRYGNYFDSPVEIEKTNESMLAFGRNTTAHIKKQIDTARSHYPLVHPEVTNDHIASLVLSEFEKQLARFQEELHRNGILWRFVGGSVEPGGIGASGVGPSGNGVEPNTASGVGPGGSGLSGVGRDGSGQKEA